jgi:hypothetical protein
MLQKSSSAHGLRAYYHSFLPVQMECHTGGHCGVILRIFAFIFPFLKTDGLLQQNSCRFLKTRKNFKTEIHCYVIFAKRFIIDECA